jgi:hypothetical protein
MLGQIGASEKRAVVRLAGFWCKTARFLAIATPFSPEDFSLFVPATMTDLGARKSRARDAEKEFLL